MAMRTQFGDADQGERICLVDQPAQIFDALVGISPRNEIAEASHDLSSPNGLRRCVSERFAHDGHILGIGHSQQIACGLDVIRHRR